MAKRILPADKWRVLLATADSSVSGMFTHRGHQVTVYNPGLSDPNAYDLVVWNGGADISPILYGERTIKGTHPIFNRDLVENELYNRLTSNIPKLGICRGAQLLNVRNGGRLWQDVNSHYGNHLMKDHLDNFKLITTSSIHHQMMRPPPGDSAWILATAELSTRKVAAYDSWHADEPEEDGDPEVIYYGHTNCLCIQGHPEYQPQSLTDYTFQTMDTLFGDDIKKRKEYVEEVHVG